MARARNIKPSLFKNELLGEADPLLTVLFTGLWCLADRDGRLEDRPKRIKAEIFPYRDCHDFNGLLTELARLGFIDRYDEGGTAVIQVINFSKHQSPHKTERPSDLPEKTENSISCLITEVAPLNDESLNVKESLIPDSLIPDSLNTDSLIPDSKTSANADLPSEKKPKPSKYKFDSGHMELAVRMSNPVKMNFPSQQIDLDQWADAVRKLQELDGRTRDQIIQLWAFVIDHEGNNGFRWRDNCRTPMKLRERKDGLPYFDLIDQQRKTSFIRKPTGAEAKQQQREEFIRQRNERLGINQGGNGNTYEGEIVNSD